MTTWHPDAIRFGSVAPTLAGEPAITRRREAPERAALLAGRPLIAEASALLPPADDRKVRPVNGKVYLTEDSLIWVNIDEPDRPAPPHLLWPLGDLKVIPGSTVKLGGRFFRWPYVLADLTDGRSTLATLAAPAPAFGEEFDWLLKVMRRIQAGEDPFTQSERSMWRTLHEAGLDLWGSMFMAISDVFPADDVITFASPFVDAEGRNHRLLILSNQRVTFVRNGMYCEWVPLDQALRITAHGGGHQAVALTTTAGSEDLWLTNDASEAVVQAFNEVKHPQPSQQSAQVDPKEQGPAARLASLQDLRDQGLISDQEYQQGRARIIGDV